MRRLFLKNKWRLPGLMLVFLIWQNVVWADTPPYPIVRNTTGKTVVERISEDNKWLSDFMIISKAGTVVVIDSFRHRNFINKVKPDIICVTHTQHREHYDPELLKQYANNNRVKKSLQKVESFTVKDVKVTGIASFHDMDATSADQEPDNVIYVFEVDGLRIAHFGGTGQAELTPEQLEALGRIDIALIEFVTYPRPHMLLDNCIHIAQQVGPQIIIPTHRNGTTIPELGETMQLPVETVDKVLVLSKSSLGEKRIVELANTLE